MADEEDYVDPRQNWVDQLLAYQAFQKIATVLQGRESERPIVVAKPAVLILPKKWSRWRRGVIKPVILAAAGNTKCWLGRLFSSWF